MMSMWRKIDMANKTNVTLNNLLFGFYKKINPSVTLMWRVQHRLVSSTWLLLGIPDLFNALKQEIGTELKLESCN